MQVHKLKALIVDDERKAIATLEALLDLYCPEVVVSHSCATMQEAIDYIATHPIDIAFLDIRIDGHNSGFDIIDAIPIPDFAIVIVTAYTDYAIKAFKYGAINYLVKPVNPTDLMATVSRVLQSRNKSIVKESTEPNADNLVKKKSFITIVNKEEIHLIDPDHIEYVEAKGSYTEIKCVNGVSYIQSKNLKYFESQVEHNKNFIRVHRSYVINIMHMQTIFNSKDSMIAMKSGKEIHTTLTNKEILSLVQ